jgi:predicted secreted protein
MPTQESPEIKHLAVQTGQPFPIKLWEDRTRGEQWVPAYETASVALVSDDYHRVAGNNAVDNGTRVFEFRALQPGQHKILFEKRMGWKFTAEDRRVFLINATDGATRGS